MEVDEEIEADLLRQFNCMNTCSRDELVKELKGVLAHDSALTDETAKFYLDMSDWNLTTAIGAYFDLESSGTLPKMNFVKDITIGEGESVPPLTQFTKTWRLSNPGPEAWPAGCRLHHTGGPALTPPGPLPALPPLPPGGWLDVSAEMRSPGEAGQCCAQYRMATPQGHYFGDTIWMIVDVAEGGTLALMQQMSNLSPSPSTPPCLPCAPPSSPAHLPNPSPFPPGHPAFPTHPSSPTPPDNPQDQDQEMGDVGMS